MRVIIFTHLICQTKRIKSPLSYLIAAAVHDIKREDDTSDKYHGLNAANWFLKTDFRIKRALNKNEIQNIYWAIRNHNLASNDANDTKNNILKVLKCADALDRYRLPRRQFWMKRKLLPLKISSWLILFAKNFIIDTEEKVIIQKIEPKKAILDSAKKYSIIV